MSRQLVGFVGVLSILLLAAVVTDVTSARGEGALPPARQTPGINAEDRFPGGCVDCHLNMPERKLDKRLSTLMAGWTDQVEPELLARLQATVPAGVKLKGRHPAVTGALRNIPDGCLSCHGSSAKQAPSFAETIHLIHLTGGEGNHFMTLFQGECTHCHKMDGRTGQWSMPSGPEK